MSKIIAIANQKGGVGKTTTSINLAASLAANHYQVLLIDLDPQGNATMGSGLDKKTLAHTANEVLLHDSSAEEACVKTTSGYDLIPANGDLTVAEVNLMERPARETFLTTALADIRKRYDFLIIDCPPALNTLTVNAFVAADSVLIPMQCEYFALEGLAALMSTIEQIKATVNRHLQLEGVLRTLYDPRNRLCAAVSGELLKHFGNKLYRTVIPRNVRLAEAPSHGLPVMHYDKTASGSAAYMVLASELISRQKIISKVLEEQAS